MSIFQDPNAAFPGHQPGIIPDRFRNSNSTTSQEMVQNMLGKGWQWSTPTPGDTVRYTQSDQLNDELLQLREELKQAEMEQQQYQAQQPQQLQQQQPQVGQQLGSQAYGTNIMQNPMLQAIQGDVTNRLFANQAARGKLGSGETLETLQNRLAPIALGFRQNEIGNLMNLFTLGANVATGQGSQAIQGAQGIGNTLMTGAANQGNAQMQAGQAQQQGFRDVAGFGGMLFNRYAPTAQAPAAAPAAQAPYTYTNYAQPAGIPWRPQ